MHLDGCHFFAWVFENPDGDYELTWYERSGDDLAMHGDYHGCERCTALMNGRKPRKASQTIELPEDAKEAFFIVLCTIAQLDEETE
jgi:hypothetical protein